jgi:hypothetical protein
MARNTASSIAPRDRSRWRSTDSDSTAPEIGTGSVPSEQNIAHVRKLMTPAEVSTSNENDFSNADMICPVILKTTCHCEAVRLHGQQQLAHAGFVMCSIAPANCTIQLSLTLSQKRQWSHMSIITVVRMSGCGGWSKCIQLRPA